MPKLNKFCILNIFIFLIAFNLEASDSVNQKTTGGNSPAQYVSPGGTGTINYYDVSEQALEKFGTEMNESFSEINKNFARCLETVIDIQNKKINELSIKLAEYISKERNIPQEKANSLAQEIIENSSMYRDFEAEKKKQEKLIEEYNEQFSKNLIANSYKLFAYLFEFVDIIIERIMKSYPNAQYKKYGTYDLIVPYSRGLKPLLSRAVLFPKGKIEIKLSQGFLNEKGLVHRCPGLDFKIIHEGVSAPVFSVAASFGGAHGTIKFGGASLHDKYKKMEIKYPYKMVTYSPADTDVLSVHFKENLIANFAEFMKFAFSACNDK